MKNTHKLKRIFLAGVVALSSAAMLSGCATINKLQAPPDEQKYSRINSIKKQLNYKSAGEVIKESYDHNSTKLEPAYLQVELEGSNTFTTIGEKIDNLDGVECSARTILNYRCTAERVSINLTRPSEHSKRVFLLLNDSLNGQDVK